MFSHRCFSTYRKRSGDLVAEAASDEHFVRPFLVNIRAAHRIFIHRILTDALFFAKVMLDEVRLEID